MDEGADEDVDGDWQPHERDGVPFRSGVHFEVPWYEELSGLWEMSGLVDLGQVI